MEKKNWLRQFADGMDLDSEPLPGIPLLELAGENRVIVEHHRGIIEYSCEKIGLLVAFGCVHICGCGLQILKMSRESLVITGRIDSIVLHRRCG